MKRLLTTLILLHCLLQVNAQNADSVWTGKRIWKDIQIGATAGLTGLGLDLKTSVAPNLGLRVGFNYMPKMSHTTGFSMTAVQGTDDGNLEEKMKRLAGYLADMVGNDRVDNIVDMQMEVNWINAKVLLDWTPFRNKKWRITAGIYAGSSHFAKACNTIEEGPTTTAMLLYNKMYDQIINLSEYEFPTFTMGSVTVELDPYTGEIVKEKFKKYGRVAVQIGELEDGTPVCLQPDEDALLRAQGKVNKVKPYLGFGFDTHLDNAKRWQLGADVGAMYWGTPHLKTKYIVNRDGENVMEDICLVHDVKNIKGVIGNYVSVAKHLPVYPVIELRLGYHLFK